jgi:formate hydrogenlyase transcriptional activator
LIFAGSPLSEVLTIIARLVEAQGEGMLRAIFLLDKDGSHVRCATAPSLPGFMEKGIRIPVNPKGEPVHVTDILSDPLWDDYRHLFLPYGLRAVWARPLLSSEGKVLGTFANYHHEMRGPSASDLQLIENASHIALSAPAPLLRAASFLTSLYQASMVSICRGASPLNGLTCRSSSSQATAMCP